MGTTFALLKLRDFRASSEFLDNFRLRNLVLMGQHSRPGDTEKLPFVVSPGFSK